MKKYAHIAVKIPLYDDELERGPQLMAVKAIKAGMGELLTTHLSEHGPVPEISHTITSDQPEKPPRKPRKAKTALTPETTPPTLGTDPEAPKAESTPAVFSKSRRS